MKDFGVTPQFATADCQGSLIKLHRWDLHRAVPRAIGARISHAITSEATHEHRNQPLPRRRCSGPRTRNQL
jgi:hypothetical protein